MDPAAADRRQPLMLILSSPSGAGKTTLSRKLLAEDGDIVMSISATTRPPRNGEQDGVHYHFLDKARFARLRDDGAFLEHARVHDNDYGTLRAEVEKALKAGRDVLFDIDYQGTQQLMANSSIKGQLVSIFILPPSMAELKRRLESRAQDSDRVVARRMAKARDEIEHWAEYDYVLINDDLERCYGAIKTILAAERLRRQKHPAFIKALLNSSES